MKTTRLILAAVLGAAGNLAVGASNPAPTSNPTPPVTVVLVEPEHFTDFRDDTGTEWSAALGDEIRNFMVQEGKRRIGADRRLEIRVTDIDLAGGFEPWLTPPSDRVRIVREGYPLRIDLEFRLTDAAGKVLSAGRRELRDMAFQMRMVFPANDPLRYEKELLRDWFHSEFGSQRKS